LRNFSAPLSHSMGSAGPEEIERKDLVIFKRFDYICSYTCVIMVGVIFPLYRRLFLMH